MMTLRYLPLLLALLWPARQVTAQSGLELGQNKYERGELRNNRRAGRWEYFDANGQPELTFDYDSSRIVFARPDTARYWLKAGEDWKLARPARSPRLLGSRAYEVELLQRNIRYPVSALVKQLQGDVRISYVVGSDGRPRDFKVEQSLSRECDQEVMRVATQCYRAWIPAIYLGRPTEARFYLLATFRIVESERALAAADKKLAARVYPGSGNYLDHVVVTALGIERNR